MTAYRAGCCALALPPLIMNQITIVTKDYNGLTADITSALGSNDINIESLDAKKIDDTGVVMLKVDQYDRALRVLQNAGWNAITEDALIVRVKDEPGAIAHLAKRFRDANLQVRSMRMGTTLAPGRFSSHLNRCGPNG